MADNVTATANANATPPAGTVFAADDISSVLYPRVKLTLGADGAADGDVDSGQQSSANSLPVVIASDQSAILTQPFTAIAVSTVTELIGINEEINQNDYSGSINVALGGTYSGEVLSVALYSTEDGTGAVKAPQGILFIFDADPALASGATALAAAEFLTVVGTIEVLTTDWSVDAAGGVAMLSHKAIPFHAVGTLYFAFKLTGTQEFNDAAGDDEQLEFRFWYRRDS